VNAGKPWQRQFYFNAGGDWKLCNLRKRHAKHHYFMKS